MKHRIKTLFLIMFASAIAYTTQAQTSSFLDSGNIELDSKDSPDTTGIQRCKDNSQAMSACRSFIKGFIQGALLTDAAIIKSIEKTESSYAERAIRTRLGNRSSPTALAGFCLPNDRTLLELAEETLGHVKNAKRNSAELAEKVYASLKVDYKCE